MRCYIKSLQVQYVAHFTGPCFQLSEARAGLLSALHGGLREHNVHFFSSDVETIENAGAFGDTLVRVRLFNGNGILEIKPAGLEATFSNAVPGDLQLIQKCLIGIVLAVERVLSSTPLATDDIRFYPVVAFQSTEERDKCLLSLSTHGPIFKSAQFSTSRIWPGLKFEIDRGPEGTCD